VHRIAARLDDQFDFLAGALSSDPERSRRSGLALNLAPERTYSDFRDMARSEAARPDGIEAVAVVVPNHLHAPVASAFLDHGVHVICDKPLATSLDDALRLRQKAQTTGLIFAVTYTYTGYPMIRHAREMVRNGDLGEIRSIQVEYAQDWLSEPLEAAGQKQAEWRTDPARAGPAGSIGDIGTHAYNLVDFITGLELAELYADISTFVPGRRVDDDANILLRYANGARGSLWVSQIAVGNENNLRVRIYGAKGGLEWAHQSPNQLLWSPLGQSRQIIARGAAGVAAAAARAPLGAPTARL
jgi:predicted dehydrogenase